MDRRRFVQGAAIAAGSLALTGCSNDVQKSSTNANKAEEIECDVAVIGSGLAGEACALAAAQGGAKVVIAEKAPSAGISFQTSKGNVSLYQGVENEEFWKFVSESTDDIDSFTARFKKATEVGKVDAPYPDYDRVKTLMTASCETISWVEATGVTFAQSFTKEKVGTDTVKPEVADQKTAPGQLVVEKMQDAISKLGGETLLSHEATSLVIEDGKVAGVKLNASGKEKALRAKAVVLACGGFGGSTDYLDKLVPSVNKVGFQYLGNTLNTGDGITMAQDAGAAMHTNDWVVPFNVMPCKELTDASADFQTLVDMSLSVQAVDGGAAAPRMLVDKEGKRFVNEAGSGALLATSMADRDAAPYYVLFDSSNAAACAILEKGVSTSAIVKAETIDELAVKASMPSLVEAFAVYQAFAAGGEDEFGKAGDKAIVYADGPFYLACYVPSYVTTLGGVKTNADCRVVDEKGSAIEGLYAVGEITHRFMYNRSFVRHCSNSVALSMGRLTGTAIAKSLA